jgi:hypothetical protein
MHDFHFKLNEESILKLSELSEEMGLSLSKTIVALFEKFLPFVEKNHLKAKEKESKYRIIAKTKEKRFSVHCYMPENLYKKMKQLHHDLNVFSLAQIIRKMIEYFILGCFKYGIKRFFVSLERVKNIWNNKKEFYKKEKIIFIRQLFYKIKNYPQILISYDENSIICGIQFI